MRQHRQTELGQSIDSCFFLCVALVRQRHDPLLALRLGESLGAAIVLPFALMARLRLHICLSVWPFLEVILVLGDDAFHPLVCPRIILRARTPIGVLPESDATSWASEGPRIFVDVLQLIGFVLYFSSMSSLSRKLPSIPNSFISYASQPSSTITDNDAAMSSAILFLWRSLNAVFCSADQFLKSSL